MKVKFTLVMDDVTVDRQFIDCIAIEWIEEVDEEKVLDLSHQWISTQNFLSNRMEGLTEIGESSLTIEPLEEGENLGNSRLPQLDL